MLHVQRRSDPRAFALLVRRWEHPIRRFCARRMGDRHLAEDLAQEAFLRVFRHRKDYRNDSRFSVYLYRIAVNVCYDELRRLKRRGETRLDDDPDACCTGVGPVAAPGPTSADDAVDREQADLVRQAVLSLPQHYQDVVVLRHYEGLKFREVADVLRIPDGTVKSRMAKALSRLAKLLGSTLDGEGPRPAEGPPAHRPCESERELT